MEAGKTDHQAEDVDDEKKYLRADLRVFGAIGFQNAPNGLWLGKQGYNELYLLESLLNHCSRRNGAEIIAITTEDDKILPGYPEDRFGFLERRFYRTNSYNVQKIDDVLISAEKLATSEKIYLVNSETIHAPRDSDWADIKVQVIGRNMIAKNLPKNYTIADVLKYSRDNGLVSLLMNSCISQQAHRVAEMHAFNADGVIAFDANNSFPNIFSRVPVLGPKIGKYTKASNERAEQFAKAHGLPGIAVSSAHYMHQIGRAGIYLDEKSLDMSRREKFLISLKRALNSNNFKNKKKYHPIKEVLKFMYLLGRYGSAPDRFKGAQSSYNER